MDAKFQSLTESQLQDVSEFRLWLSDRVEEEFIKEMTKYDPFPDILKGIGSPICTTGLYTTNPSKNHYDSIIDAMKQLTPLSR